jgi:EmrB/QacA subfamily drug resistance transporter
MNKLPAAGSDWRGISRSTLQVPESGIDPNMKHGPTNTHPGVSTKWLVMIGVGMGVLMATLDSSIVNISLPTLVDAFKTDFATVQWVVISYLVVITSLMLGAARLGDMYDKKKLYLGGLVLFTTGSFLCAISPSVEFLIGFRALQGLGATFTQALGSAIITQIFPSEERGRALGVIAGIVAVGIALGPPLGGIIIGLTSWHVVFLVNVPIGIVALFIVVRFLPALPTLKSGQRFDLAGAVLLFGTLGCYALAMTYGQQFGFGASKVIWLLIISTIGLVMFIFLESRIQQPMVEIYLFRNLLFDLNLMMGFLVYLVLAGLFILPFYLELVQGYSTIAVGLLLMVQPIAMGAIAPVAGRLSDRFGSRGISLIGLVLVTLGALAVSTLRAGVSPFGFAIRVIFLGLGMGLFASPNNSAIMGAVPRERLGITSGLLSLSRTLGGTTGLPLIGSIYTATVLLAGHLPTTTDITTAGSSALVAGIQSTFRIAALFILAATILAVAALLIDINRRRTQRAQAKLMRDKASKHQH